nr:hypothetical protein [Mycobacterium marseillense]
MAVRPRRIRWPRWAVRPRSGATAGGPGNLLGGMPLAGAGAGGHGVAGPKYGFRPTVMARPPFAG